MNYDPSDETVRRYLEDIRKTHPLSKKEEQELFRKCRKGSASAREKLLSSNMRFVLKVALQYRGSPLGLPDVVSEGAMGLMRAIESFDHTRGLKFISYAVWWIKAYITRAINEQGSLIRLPANQHLKVRKALKSMSNGESVNQAVQELIRIGESGARFDSSQPYSQQASFEDSIADENGSSPEKEVEICSVEHFARNLLCELHEREATVIRSLYGIGIETPQTLREIGENLNISHERVRQLRDKALRRLKKSRIKNELRENYEGYLEAIA